MVTQDDIKKMQIRKMSDEQLVEFVYDKTPMNTDTETAKAELLRRQMETVREFNETSTIWSRRVFWLTVVIGVLAFAQLAWTLFPLFSRR